MNGVRDFFITLLIMILLIITAAFETAPGTFSWTYDGTHHVLKIGETK